MCWFPKKDEHMNEAALSPQETCSCTTELEFSFNVLPFTFDTPARHQTYHANGMPKSCDFGARPTFWGCQFQYWLNRKSPILWLWQPQWSLGHGLGSEEMDAKSSPGKSMTNLFNDWISEVSKSLVPTVGYCMIMHKGLIYWYFRYVLGSINSHYFHMIGDGHKPNSRRLYTHYKDSPEKGGMSLSPIEGVEKDPGTYDLKNPHDMLHASARII